ncbi:hypothetical protein [Sulfoacidibacillus thermotolerans]|uniref:Uncharacterized protein n=1 Tax=Sulfoacidibacillus thermotolerans TaxID=1765684 RepID=A0A2U3D9Y4_SULT2|nr:hypothetical protein [Sulfoacidibacillus thermotolerans]PWI58097.1 hypothetical protein BM613_05385 [Sulfoacidibacillus thermotolerans]
MNPSDILITLIAPLLLIVYLWSFIRWLWRHEYRLGAVGGAVLMVVSCGGTLTYFLTKLLS